MKTTETTGEHNVFIIYVAKTCNRNSRVHGTGENRQKLLDAKEMYEEGKKAAEIIEGDKL